jgi:hypothetical protein
MGAPSSGLRRRDRDDGTYRVHAGGASDEQPGEWNVTREHQIRPLVVATPTSTWGAHELPDIYGARTSQTT